MVLDMLSGLKVPAGAKGLSLVCGVDPDVPARVCGDPGRLRQILVNLVGNAIKFTQRGEVLVTIESCPDVGGIELHFKVKDTGIGIPAEQQGLLFKAFSQADSSTTRKYGGTGLGLAISARLVELMQGRLWVESSQDKGSTFHFTAKFAASGTISAPPSLAAAAELKGIPLLVVDDNETNRRIVCGMTRAWGMRPTAVENGPLALARIETAQQQGEPFRLVVIDSNMPDMDGFELAEKIQATGKNSGLQSASSLLMLTSSGRPGDVERCGQVG